MKIVVLVICCLSGYINGQTVPYTLPYPAQYNGVFGPITGIGGRCLDVYRGYTANGTPIQVYTCNGGSNQAWEITAENTIQILGKCLDLTGGNTANGTPVELYDCIGSYAQRWYLAGNQIKHYGSNKCLQVRQPANQNEAVTEIWDCDSQAANQQWNTGSKNSLSGEIRTVGNRCVDIANGDPYNGATIQAYDCNGTPGQRWLILGDGTIRSFGKCLDLNGGGNTDGTKAVLRDCNGSTSQKWYYESNGATPGAGNDRILTMNASGRCLDVYAPFNQNSAFVGIWVCNGNSNQVFYTHYVAPPYATVPF